MQLGRRNKAYFHLSYEFSKGDKLGSLNYYTPKERCTVKYKDLDFAVQPYLRLYDEIIELKKLTSEQKMKGQQDAKIRWSDRFDKRSHQKIKPVIYAGKSDIKSAF